ncbi:Laminin subunit gamma-1 [Amphibalanus amphitrite]|uniref:Laminin subunit gamma-1 n=1 Tax=Amphibalanus amphitrite TaxID=1232801 RepID=A0A6A4W6T3_AMPAM|nr:Laminin subunit gamma-1 [Amphibalanus amphitrite]
MNAAFGRRVRATNTCGVTKPTNFCGLTDKICDVCIDGDPYRQHPPSYLTDFNNFENETWWQSETMMDDIQYPSVVNLTLDLGKAFDITYIRLKFKSPRPESFAIYKKYSADSDWVPYQYYSTTGEDSLTLGTVPVLQHWVTATAIRITLNRLNTFGDEVFRDPRVLQSYYYAITDFAVGGTCKCNGHASNCVPSTSESGEERLVCQCQHNTAGADCQRCLPFYNDVPWRRATPDEASECQACNCNGYSNRCFFDQELYDKTGHGGHCTDCIANRAGVNCERCQENHYEREDGYCIPCDCHPEGSRSLQCNINGKCSCKPGVGGEKCDRCEANFFDFSSQGCRPCNCHVAGSLANQPSCDPDTGVCSCKANVEGQTCDRCKPGFFSIDEQNQFGCTPCFCFGHSSICDAATGYSEVVPQSEFVRSDEGWTAVSYSGQPVSHAYRPLVQVIAVSSPSQEAVYFSAPGERPRWAQLDPWLRATDSGLALQRNQEFTFRLHEHADFGWSPRLRARDFIALLSNLTAIKIRATYTPEGKRRVHAP